MTEAQRSWLEHLSRAPVAALDVMPGSSVQCLNRLIRSGYVLRVAMADHIAYQITRAGRAALAPGEGS